MKLPQSRAYEKWRVKENPQKYKRRKDTERERDGEW